MMLYPMQEIKFVTINDLYKYAVENSLTLFPSFTSTFWNMYDTDHASVDRYFARRFKTYYYFFQDANDTPENVLPDFKDAITDLFNLNLKRYTELFRINLVDDETYSIIDNYDVSETKDGTNGKTITDVFGQRVSTANNTTGQQTDTETDTVAPYDSETFSNREQISNVKGQRTDTSAFTSNAVTDTHTHSGSDGYTLHRKGNIGVQTQSEVMGKHVDFWKAFSFYDVLFNDICTEYLLIDRGYI